MDNGERFVRVLGQRNVIALAFGAMIGFGWVPLVGTWLTEAGSLGAILAFLIGGTVVVFVGLTYSELVSAMRRRAGSTTTRGGLSGRWELSWPRGPSRSGMSR